MLFNQNFKASQLEQMISQGEADAVAAVAQNVVISENFEAVDSEGISNISYTARKFFIEAYESLFEQYDVNINTVASE